MRISCLTAALGVAIFACEVLAQDPSEVEISTGVLISTGKLIDLCESCHGPRGVSEREGIPSLAGQPVEAIMEALENFRFRERHCPATEVRQGDTDSEAVLDMCNISQSMSRTEKTALAEYFSEQGVRPVVADPDP